MVDIYFCYAVIWINGYGNFYWDKTRLLSCQPPIRFSRLVDGLKKGRFYPEEHR